MMFNDAITKILPRAAVLSCARRIQESYVPKFKIINCFLSIFIFMASAFLSECISGELSLKDPNDHVCNTDYVSTEAFNGIALGKEIGAIPFPLEPASDAVGTSIIEHRGLPSWRIDGASQPWLRGVRLISANCKGRSVIVGIEYSGSDGVDIQSYEAWFTKNYKELIGIYGIAFVEKRDNYSLIYSSNKELYRGIDFIDIKNTVRKCRQIIIKAETMCSMPTWHVILRRNSL